MRYCILTTRLFATLITIAAASACTDWQAAGGAQGPALVGGAQPGQPVGGARRGLPDGGPTWIETWQAPTVEVAPVARADAGVANDFFAPSDGGQADGAATDGSPQATLDASGPAEVGIVLPDGGTAPIDALDDGGVADVGGGDAQAKDGATAETTPYTFDGKADFLGWPELPLQIDAASDPDGAVDVQADGVIVPPDGVVQPEDAGPSVDAPPPIDALPPIDAPVADDSIAPADAAIVDADPIDAGPADGGQSDAAIDDITEADSAPADTALSDTTVADTGIADPGAVDTAQPDLSPNETSADAGGAETTTVDGLLVPDWQGYPSDLPYAADADIYGGPIGSCLSLWLYQNEACGDVHPTAACINSAAKDGSLYSQFLFEPLRECQTAVCTSLCANATDKSCMEGCVGKYCTAQFLACTSNAASGSDTCANTWNCSQQYKDKLLTISAKCYANASFPEQKKFASILSCVSKPQTKSCLPDIAACFAGPTPGVETCSNTLICIDGCKNNESCGFACMGKGTPKAVTLLDAIWTCQIEKCQPKCAGSSDPKCSDTCLQQDCKDQLVQCLID